MRYSQMIISNIRNVIKVLIQKNSQNIDKNIFKDVLHFCIVTAGTSLTMQIPAETLSQSHMVCLSGKKETQKQGFPTSRQKKASRIKILRYKSRN